MGRIRTVDVRLVGDEEDVKIAIERLTAPAAPGAARRLAFQFRTPRKGRKGEEWLAYGTCVIEDAPQRTVEPELRTPKVRGRR